MVKKREASTNKSLNSFIVFCSWVSLGVFLSFIILCIQYILIQTDSPYQHQIAYPLWLFVFSMAFSIIGFIALWLNQPIKKNKTVKNKKINASAKTTDTLSAYSCVIAIIILLLLPLWGAIFGEEKPSDAWFDPAIVRAVLLSLHLFAIAFVFKFHSRLLNDNKDNGNA